MSNAVDVVALIMVGDRRPHYSYCLHTWQFWTRENNVGLFVLDDAPRDVPVKMSKWYALPAIERDGIEYEHVAIIDGDTMVRWDCPNFFHLAAGRFSAVRDLSGIGYIVDSIEAHRPHFGFEVDWWDYFNSGLVVVSKEHGRIGERMLQWGRTRPIIDTGRFFPSVDQTLLNFVAREETQVNLLPLPYNLTHIQRRDLYRYNNYLRAGCVWHFNEPGTLERMKSTWDLVRHHYE